MKIYHYVIISLLLLSGCNIEGTTDSLTMKKLDKSAFWFITEGVGLYHKKNDFSIIERYIKNFNVYFYYNNLVKGDGCIEGILLEKAGVGADILCFERIEDNDKIYEYWAIINESKSTYYKNKIRFLFTITAGLTEKRKIIDERKEFLEKYIFPDGTIIRFPIENINSIYNMHPWIHKDAFDGTKYEGVTKKELQRKMKIGT